MPKKRLLITGASGMLGYALCRRARASHEVCGVCSQGEIAVDGVVSVRADFSDPDALADCLDRVRPGAVIHAAAMSQPNDCERRPEESKKINLLASVGIARWCSKADIPLVFTSSDLVFDGEKPPYGEEDPVSPICVYGEHKAAAEKTMREIYPETTLCRMPLMLGHAPGSGSGFLGFMVRTLREKRKLTLFTDEFRTPVDTDSAAGGLLMALEKRGALLHLGGPLRMSRFTMGCLVADLLKADHDLLKPVCMADLPMSAPRSPDVSLKSTRAYAWGYRPEDLPGVLEKIVPRIEREI